jgi:hypothetical protein
MILQRRSKIVPKRLVCNSLILGDNSKKNAIGEGTYSLEPRNPLRSPVANPHFETLPCGGVVSARRLWRDDISTSTSTRHGLEFRLFQCPRASVVLTGAVRRKVAAPTRSQSEHSWTAAS